jgi:hypothetical protein
MPHVRHLGAKRLSVVSAVRPAVQLPQPLGRHVATAGRGECCEARQVAQLLHFRVRHRFTSHEVESVFSLLRSSTPLPRCPPRPRQKRSKVHVIALCAAFAVTYTWGGLAVLLGAGV